jgi:glyoxylase-like metal-dependent hydrolase (beta-lactamase superfamily II)
MAKVLDDIRVGNISVSPVVDDAHTLFDALHLFPDATEESLAAEFSWMLPRFYDPASKCFKSVVQGFVFSAGGKTVLVDTCVGNDKPGRPRPEWTNAKFPFLDNLARAGVQPKDVDVVLCTHLHVDHSGWNTRLDNGRWVPTFPNAEYLTNATELAALERRRDHGPAFYRHLYEDSMLPVLKSGQAVTVGMDHKVAAGVALEPSPGHTPGHVSVRIGEGKDSAVAIGDMMHHPIQAVHPDWNSRHCEIPELARATRREFLERIADTGVWVLPGHFAPCRAKRHAENFRFDFG